LERVFKKDGLIKVSLAGTVTGFAIFFKFLLEAISVTKELILEITSG
jgi:hypothetical protein